MKQKTLDLTPELFVEFCKATKENDHRPRSFVVFANPLPEDAEVVNILLREPYPPYTLQLVITSETFDEVPDGANPPELPLPLYRMAFGQEVDQIKGCDKCDLCDTHADYMEGKHYTPDKNNPICIHCGLADIAGDWDKFPCNDEWRKVIATNY